MGNEQYYEMMARLDFLPNSPTLFNLGTGKGTFSACFKFDIGDSMDSIMDCARKAALVQKWGGGVGYYFGNLRAKGAKVQGTGNHAGGPVGFLKMYNAIGDCITQSGKRAAAQMGILPIEHPDAAEWITCKNDDPDAISTFNISVSIPDSFMEAIVTHKASEKQKYLFNLLVESAWKTGDPGVFFVDRAEEDNPTPHLGKLTGTNPCGEVPLLDNEPCNLGSINLRNMYDPITGVNFAYLEKTVKLAVRFLDDILDANEFPDPAITAAAKTTRKLGLGVMGWADLLALMKIPYASMEAVEMGEEVMKLIQKAAHLESKILGAQKGSYPALKPNIAPSVRNATVTCIAPTGTLSLLAGVSSGIEPHFRLKWEREMGDGTILKEHATVLDECGNFVPETTNDISWSWHVKHQAAFQKHTDLAVSKTINLPNKATVEDIRNAYITMWNEGCKGGTVFRDGCRDKQVLTDVVSTVNVAPVIPVNGRKKMPKDVETIRHKMKIEDMEAYLFGGKYDNGQVGELFITATKEGTTIAGLLDAIAILTSIALQRGETTEQLAKKFAGTRFEPFGITGNSKIPVATSPVDYIFRWLDSEFGNGNGHEGESSGMICPECNSPAYLSGGCITCADSICAWSKCG
jgi:ribonucleoside-diphosphate reductase alpha chain